MDNVHVFCFFASYVLALALDGLRLWRRGAILRALALGLGFAGLAAQSLYLVARSRATDLPPLLSSGHDWLLVLAWTAVVFYLFLSVSLWIIDRDIPMGLFILPVVLLLIGAADVAGNATSPALSGATDVALGTAQQTALRGWGMLHASFLVFGIAGVIIGLVFSLMYVVQHRRLKQRQPVQVGLSLPSLATLARLNWWSVVVSIPLLTLGLLTGVRLVFLTRETAGPIGFGDPLVVGSVVVWIVMVAFFLWLLRTDNLGGKQIALRTLYAFAFLLITLIGLEVLTGGHRTTRSSARERFGEGLHLAASESVRR
jgi:Cytochrome C assembly protein